jgi:hypothetical protein
MTTPSTIWAPDAPLPRIAELPLPERVSHIVLHRGDDAYRFLHESAIARHHGRWFVAWNNSPAAESEPGTVVRWIASDNNFANWTPPATLAPPLRHESTIWESCQLLATEDGLWAFVGQVHCQPRQPAESGGRMVIFRLDEAARQWREEGTAEGFHPLNRPQRTAAGHWVMGGQFNLTQPRVAISHGDNLARWKVVDIPSRPEDKVNYAETALNVTDDLLRAYVRTEKGFVYLSESRDDGHSWDPLRESNLPASSSKMCAGTLSTGQHYLAFNMLPQEAGVWGRDVLVVAVSAPGEVHFRKIVPIRNGRSPEARVAGFCKGPQWSYPSVWEHDHKVHITYSVTKEDCALSILPTTEFAT